MRIDKKKRLIKNKRNQSESEKGMVMSKHSFMFNFSCQIFLLIL
jgi:hypothetical protein